MGRTLKRWAREGELFGDVILGQWFTFQDVNGVGHCQPDILIDTPSHLVVIECKLTQTDKAWMQLVKLYKPVMEMVFAKPVFLVQACKNLRHSVECPITCIAEFVAEPKRGVWTWHYLAL